MNDRKDDKVRIGRMWKGVSAKGSNYLSGVIDTEGWERAENENLMRLGWRLLALPNQSKREGKRDPDVDLFLVPDRRPGK